MKLRTAVDVTLPNGFPIKTKQIKTPDRTLTTFPIRLAPCEWTVVYCGQSAE